MKKWFSQNWLIVLSGLVIGAAAVTLTALGNPGNMGFCIACFLRDTSGALGLHSAPVVQYFRPEIVGIVLGALIAAIAAKEFKGHGGSSPVLRFVLGAFVMIGALMFLGCPLRMVIRLGGGDLNALVGLVGFIAGILVGIVFLKKGFSLQRSYRQMKAEGAAFPLVLVGLYVVYLLFKTAFKASEEGPGSMHAAIGVALAIGVIVGILCQRSRMCMVGGIRNSVMFRDFGLISGFLAKTGTLGFALLVLGYMLSNFGQYCYYLIMMISILNTVEYNEYKFGTRDEAVIASLRPFITKLASALIAVLTSATYLLFDVTSYTNQISSLEQQCTQGLITESEKLDLISGVLSSTTSLQSTGLLLCMSLLPCAMMLLSYFLYKKKYILDETEYDRICVELEKRHAA